MEVEMRKCQGLKARLTSEAPKRNRVEAGIQSVVPYKRERYELPKFDFTMESIVREVLLLKDASEREKQCQKKKITQTEEGEKIGL